MASIRSDFISDGSSSDSDDLPEIGSLRERLARKRKLLLGDNKDRTASVSSTIDKQGEDNNNRSQSPEVVVISEKSRKYSSDNQESDNYQETVDLTFDDPEPCPSELDVIHNQNDNAVDYNTLKLQSDNGASYNTLSNENQHNTLWSDTASNCSTVSTMSTVSTASVDVNAKQKNRKKRTTEEIEENRRKAQEKKEERERIKMAKEAEKQMRKAERESKKQVSLGSCLKYITVLVDTHIVNTCGCGSVLYKALEELGVTCQTRELRVPYTIMWERQTTESSIANNMRVETIQTAIEERDVLAVIPVSDFVSMVHSYKQQQRGLYDDGLTLREYVQQQQNQLEDKSITILVPGLEQYFRDQKSQTKKKHKDAVRGTNTDHAGSKSGKGRSPLVTVSRVDVEEAVTDTLLQTNCSTQMVDTHDELADFVRRFSKAVAERPAKKDRFDPVFSFHEEGVGGVKVDKNGVGLLKVWKQQLMQFKNISPDIAQAIITVYPSPRLLSQAYQKCSNEKEGIGVLENILVRRGAGVLETTRRVGKELSRRVYTFFTSEDPHYIIK